MSEIGLDNLLLYKKKLATANNIIKEIAQNEKNITPITSADYIVFEDFFEQEEKHTYGNSWIYVTQGTYGIGPEKLGYKYSDGKNLCAISIFPKIEDPNILMIYWIRPLGPNMLSIILDYAERIKQRYGVCCYVKKLFLEQYEFLLQHNFRSAKEFPWHSSAHSEDDTHPELIYNREKTLNAIFTAPRRRSLGSTLRQTFKLKRENVIELTTDNFANCAWNIVNSYFLQYDKFSKKTNISSPADYYNMIFRENYCNKNIEKKILQINRVPMGFYVLTRDRKFDTTILYGCIVKREYHKCLTDHLYISWFSTEKTKFINLGGSEDEGIFTFKTKYLPIKRQTMYWATNYPL